MSRVFIQNSKPMGQPKAAAGVGAQDRFPRVASISQRYPHKKIARHVATDARLAAAARLRQVAQATTICDGQVVTQVRVPEYEKAQIALARLALDKSDSDSLQDNVVIPKASAQGPKLKRQATLLTRPSKVSAAVEAKDVSTLWDRLQNSESLGVEYDVLDINKVFEQASQHCSRLDWDVERHIWVGKRWTGQDIFQVSLPGILNPPAEELPYTVYLDILGTHESAAEVRLGRHLVMLITKHSCAAALFQRGEVEWAKVVEGSPAPAPVTRKDLSALRKANRESRSTALCPTQSEAQNYANRIQEMLTQCGELVDGCKQLYAGGELSTWEALYNLTMDRPHVIAWGDPRWKRLKASVNEATVAECKEVYSRLRTGRVVLLRN